MMPVAAENIIMAGLLSHTKHTQEIANGTHVTALFHDWPWFMPVHIAAGDTTVAGAKATILKVSAKAVITTEAVKKTAYTNMNVVSDTFFKAKKLGRVTRVNTSFIKFGRAKR